MVTTFLEFLNIDTITRIVLPLITLIIVSIGAIIAFKNYQILTTQIKLKIFNDEESDRLRSSSDKEMLIYVMNVSDQAYGFKDGGIIRSNLLQFKGVKHSFKDMELGLNPTHVFVIQKRRTDFMIIKKDKVRTYFKNRGYAGKFKIQAFLIDNFGNEYKGDNFVTLDMDDMHII